MLFQCLHYYFWYNQFSIIKLATGRRSNKNFTTLGVTFYRRIIESELDLWTRWGWSGYNYHCLRSQTLLLKKVPTESEILKWMEIFQLFPARFRYDFCTLSCIYTQQKLWNNHCRIRFSRVVMRKPTPSYELLTPEWLSIMELHQATALLVSENCPP